MPYSTTCTNSISAAKLFVQQLMAPARCTSARQQPVLDFLVPRARKRTCTTFRSGPSPTPSFVRPACFAISSAGTGSAVWAATPRRGVATTTTSRRTRPSPATRRRYTQTAYNPQKDDDGNEMKLEITPRAAKRLAEIMRKDANPHLALRIQVESGGCHGFQYLMSLVTLPSELPPRPAAGADPSTSPGQGAESGAVREDDIIFTYTPDEEASATAAHVALADAPKIILDQPSLELLKGSKVDYTMELIGSQFKIVDNPLATSSCGCGTSFDIQI